MSKWLASVVSVVFVLLSAEADGAELSVEQERALQVASISTGYAFGAFHTVLIASALADEDALSRSWVAGTTGGTVKPENGLIGEPWGATIKVLTARSVDALQTEHKECARGEPGMIWVNTPALMKGYFQRPDLTDAVVCQGWFMTGDIGTIDEQGRLHIRGRERDEINKGGIKVFPADIDAVAQMFHAVTDVCTFGIDDELYGENIAMGVVLSDRADTTIIGLFGWLADHLAEHKRPVRWYALEEIPRTSRGKINRDIVKAACLDIEPLDLRTIVRDCGAS